jgi:hypothetical protein
MYVAGREFLISPQGGLSDEEWSRKLQAKANLFSAAQ